MFLFLCLISCKSSYTKIGDKNANYITYYLKVYEADSLFLTNNFEKSYFLLDSLFKKYEPINIDGIYEFNIYISSGVMSGNVHNLRNKIKNSLIKYGSRGVALHPDSNIIREKIKQYISFNKEYEEKLLGKYKKRINLTLRSKIEKMIIEDQRVRMNNIDNDSMLYFQNKHKVEIFNIFNNFGYPSLKKVGSDNLFNNSANISVLFLHQDNETKKKILPFLLENVMNGNCDPDIYAVLYDRYYWETSINNGKEEKQYFGSYLKNFKTGELGLPVENELKLDSIRNSIGLSSLNYSTWRLNKTYNF
jgi:hypothetical protein